MDGPISNQRPEPDCPVCLTIILPPVFQCHNGHLICEKCIAGLQACPVCQHPLPTEERIRNLVLEEIIRTHHPCQYREKGCEAVIKYDQIDDDLYDCRYADLQLCSMLGFDCKKDVTVSDFCRHVEEHHGWPTRGPLQFDKPYRFTGSLQKSNARMYCLQTCGPSVSVFVLKTKPAPMNEDQMEWSVTVLGGKDFARQFWFEIKLRDANGNSRVTWNGPVLSLQSEAQELEACFITSARHLKTFSIIKDGRDKLVAEVKICKREVSHDSVLK